MQRLDEILKLVSEFEKIDVNSLSEKLQVSKVTIRKDLDKLESKGLLHREHGYAVLNSGDDINVRLTYQYDNKKIFKLFQKYLHGTFLFPFYQFIETIFFLILPCLFCCQHICSPFFLFHP